MFVLFRTRIDSKRLRPGDGLLLPSAISQSILRYDGNGNPALDKGKSLGRIDALSASVLAVGIGSRRPPPAEFHAVHIGHDGRLSETRI